MEIEAGQIKATPSKRLFLSIIADYDLNRSICELVDNEGGGQMKINFFSNKNLADLPDDKLFKIISTEKEYKLKVGKYDTPYKDKFSISLRLLKHPDEGVRIQAVRALNCAQKEDKKSAFRGLTDKLISDTSNEVRRHAFVCLSSNLDDSPESRLGFIEDKVVKAIANWITTCPRDINPEFISFEANKSDRFFKQLTMSKHFKELIDALSRYAENDMNTESLRNCATIWLCRFSDERTRDALQRLSTAVGFIGSNARNGLSRLGNK